MSFVFISSFVLILIVSGFMRIIVGLEALLGWTVTPLANIGTGIVILLIAGLVALYGRCLPCIRALFQWHYLEGSRDD